MVQSQSQTRMVDIHNFQTREPLLLLKLAQLQTQLVIIHSVYGHVVTPEEKFFGVGGRLANRKGFCQYFLKFNSLSNILGFRAQKC